jgi:hypothetical protein
MTAASFKIRVTRRALIAVMLLLCGVLVAQDNPPPAPPAKATFVVTAVLGEPDKAANPNVGADAIEIKATVVAKQLKPNQPQAVIHIEGVLKDFYGADVPDGHVAVDITVKNGETKTEARIAKPTPMSGGPFFFTGKWSEKDGDEKGDLSAAFGAVYSRTRIDDFETPKFKVEKDELEYTFSAQYGTGWQGHNGLSVHLPKAADGGKLATKSLQFDAALPGRAVKIGMFFKATGNLQISAVLKDTRKPDAAAWTVEPLNLPPTDWRYIEIPIYGHAVPGEDYRWTLKELVFQGAPGTGFFLDDLDVLTQRDVQVSFAPAGAAIPFGYTGSKIHPNGQMEGINDRRGETHLFGACTQPMDFKVRVAALGKERSVHFSATVHDYNGVELPKLEFDLNAAAGQTAEKTVSITSTEANAGPFYIDGAWSEANSDNKDTFSEVVGQANWRMVLEDFEQYKFPDAGSALENSPAAKHSGEMGLIVRPRPGKPPADPNLCATTIPMGFTLTGRPVKVGLWMKTPAAVQVRMQLRDPGVNHMGGMRYDSWNVGPVDVPAGDWRYVEIPMPDYCAPAAKRKSFPETNGVLDYPLTLENISVIGPLNTEVLVDDIELWSQAQKSDATVLRAYSNKPSGILYRNDRISIVIANAWLWGGPLDVHYNAKLENLFGQQYPLLKDAAASIAPGTAHVDQTPVTNLPLGSYAFTLEARAGGTVIATIPPAKTAENPHPEQSFLVYEPQGKPLPVPELYALLRDRNKLVAELGFQTNTMNFTWHSKDNSPAIENFPGYFYFDWLMPEVKKRKEAGLGIIGTLGLTPQFYDPSAQFIKVYSEWFGNTITMPSRSIYFEEYAHRTIEHFAGQVDTWIVWERPDGNNFATAEEYTDKMLEVAHRAATEANPNAKLISGAITYENIIKYLTDMIEAGGHHYIDGIGILPSPAPLSPEDGNLEAVLSRAQLLRKQEQVKPELWVMNLAWTTGDTDGTVSELNQSLYIPRAWVICQAAGIQHIFVQPDHTQEVAVRNSADLIYPAADGFSIKPAALSTKTVSTLMKDATIIGEVFLNDRWDGLTRSYLFKQPDGKLLLAAWRREGSSVLPFMTKPDAVYDTFGNSVDLGGSPQLTLCPAPQYAIFSNIDATALIKQLERAVITYDDAPESAWKTQFTFHLDVGDSEDEKAANYAVTDARLVGPVDSYYYSEYGRHVVDSGRHFKGQESFVMDVSKFGTADLVLRKRINYSVRNQLVKVYCNDQFVGQWCAPLSDRRFRWRDIEYVVPNSFFAGKNTASFKFVNASDAEATSYYYWGGPLRTKKVFASDLSLLCGTAGPGAPFVLRDKNVIGGAMSFPKKPGPFLKGLGTNSGSKMEESLVVLCLNKQFKTLHGVVGIDNCTNGNGTVQFYVGSLKGKMLYDSKYMTAYDEPKTFDVDVSDQIAVMLWVGDGKDGTDSDVANWADLQLELK